MLTNISLAPFVIKIIILIIKITQTGIYPLQQLWWRWIRSYMLASVVNYSIVRGEVYILLELY